MLQLGYALLCVSNIEENPITNNAQCIIVLCSQKNRATHFGRLVQFLVGAAELYHFNEVHCLQFVLSRCTMCIGKLLRYNQFKDAW